MTGGLAQCHVDDNPAAVEVGIEGADGGPDPAHGIGDGIGAEDRRAVGHGDQAGGGGGVVAEGGAVAPRAGAAVAGDADPRVMRVRFEAQLGKGPRARALDHDGD